MTDRVREALIRAALDWSGAEPSTSALWRAIDEYRDALSAPPQEPVVPAYRGYAALGTGQYCINHSRAGEPAELVITLATEDDKRGRQVGESRDNPPDAPPIQADEMVIRIAFTSERGLFALEDQLARVRRVHFADAHPPAAPADGLPDATPRDADETFHHPARQAMFRAGLLACREYMARFVESQAPAIAQSIRANWWPNLGDDPGPPRQNDWAEWYEGEYPDGRVTGPKDPSVEALPHALTFLDQCARPPLAAPPAAPAFPQREPGCTCPFLDLGGPHVASCKLAAPPAAPACPSCNAPGLLYECVACSATNYPPAATPAQAAPRKCDCGYTHFGYPVKGCASNFPTIPATPAQAAPDDLVERLRNVPAMEDGESFNGYTFMHVVKITSDAADEIARLRAELAEAQDMLDHAHDQRGINELRAINAERERDEARADAERLVWVLPLIGGSDTPDADARTLALGKALMRGLTDREAIDAARELAS